MLQKDKKSESPACMGMPTKRRRMEDDAYAGRPKIERWEERIEGTVPSLQDSTGCKRLKIEAYWHGERICERTKEAGCEAFAKATT